MLLITFNFNSFLVINFLAFSLTVFGTVFMEHYSACFVNLRLFYIVAKINYHTCGKKIPMEMFIISSLPNKLKAPPKQQSHSHQ